MVARTSRHFKISDRMNFLKRLFGLSDDPTAEWPVLNPAAPPFDVRTRHIGPLPFGSPVADAVIFGRPDYFTGHPTNCAALIYAQSGFSLDYEEGRLVFVTYFVGPNEFAGRRAIAGASRPTVISALGASHEIYFDCPAETLTAALGTPGSAELEEEESILEWEIAELTVEAELNAQSQVKRLNLFLTK
jgi:hypothetical protein